MTIKELKDIIATASDSDKLELVNGKITLIKAKPVEYKFKVGDKVKDNGGHIGVITSLIEVNGWPWYQLNGESLAAEEWLELVPQDITERIKAFDDAVEWCERNGKESLVDDFNGWPFEGEGVEDVIAYLKLRIITCALNEGWEPLFDDDRYCPYFYPESTGVCWEKRLGSFPVKLCYRTQELASYAGKQFKEIYADFCGVKKGGDQ